MEGWREGGVEGKQEKYLLLLLFAKPRPLRRFPLLLKYFNLCHILQKKYRVTILKALGHDIRP